jgi:hypothetical protein
MSSRPRLIAATVGGILAGIALFALTLVVVAIDGPALSGQMMAILVLGTMLGFVLDAAWLSLAIDRLSKFGHGRQDEEGGEGWEGPGPDPERPWPPSEDPDWWPAFERDLGVYREARERTPVTR